MSQCNIVNCKKLYLHDRVPSFVTQAYLTAALVSIRWRLQLKAMLPALLQHLVRRFCPAVDVAHTLLVLQQHQMRSLLDTTCCMDYKPCSSCNAKREHMLLSPACNPGPASVLAGRDADRKMYCKLLTRPYCWWAAIKAAHDPMHL